MIMLPLLAVGAGTVATLTAAAISRTGRAPVLTASATLVCALLALGPAVTGMPGGYTVLFVFDGLSALSTALVLFASFGTLLLADPYLDMHDLPQGEFSVLLLIGTLGGLVLASAGHFASLFLGVELVGIPLASLAAYHRGRAEGAEAGFKYLVLAGMSSAVLLFGIALLYAATGTLSFGAAYADHGPLSRIGLLLLLGGMGFKLALFPFHFWAPDVYDGAPAPVSAFAATAVKAAAFTALLRLFPPDLIARDRLMVPLLSVVSIASMTLGNIAALRQRNVKRMFAYSSIAHNGYILVAFLAAGERSAPAVLLYLASYVLMNLAAFGVVSLLSHGAGDAADLDEYAGLSWRLPGPAAILMISVLSLLGLPLTAGFIAKFSVIAAGMEAMLLAPVLALVVNTVVSAYYYLRVVRTMFLGRDEVPDETARQHTGPLPLAGRLVIGLQAVLLLGLGVAPQYLIRLIERLLA